MSRHLFEQLCLHGGPEQKCIVFCASDPHAERVTAELGNLYADWCAANGQEPKAAYAFKCTAKSGGGDFIADLRESLSSHFLACTVELLSTGVDVPSLRNVAFFQYIKSPIVFAQMLGRGTRLDGDKLMFRVWDYTDATRLIGDEFKVKPRSEAAPKTDPPPPKSAIVVEQVQIHIGSTGRWLTAVLDGRQQRITVEEYRERIAARLVASAADLTAFRGLSVVPPERRGLLAEIVSGGLSPKALQMAEEATDYDLLRCARRNRLRPCARVACKPGLFLFVEAKTVVGSHAFAGCGDRKGDGKPVWQGRHGSVGNTAHLQNAGSGEGGRVGGAEIVRSTGGIVAGNKN